VRVRQARSRLAGRGRLCRSRASLSVAALRRRAAACGDRPRARKRAVDLDGGRADGQSRQRQRAARDRPLVRGQSRARHDADPGHARSRPGRPRRRPARAPRWTRRGATYQATGGLIAMVFVFRMLVRETRASWRRLLFFFLCVAIGVSAIAAMRSAIQNVRAGLAREARTLTAADLVIQGTRASDADTLAIMERRLACARVRATTDTVETPTMVRPSDPGKAVARMVELQAIEPAFPLYGTVTLLDGKTYAHALLAHGGVIVRPELLAQLGVSVGESIVIGQATF